MNKRNAFFAKKLTVLVLLITILMAASACSSNIGDAEEAIKPETGEIIDIDNGSVVEASTIEHDTDTDVNANSATGTESDISDGVVMGQGADGKSTEQDGEISSGEATHIPEETQVLEETKVSETDGAEDAEGTDGKPHLNGAEDTGGKPQSDGAEDTEEKSQSDGAQKDETDIPLRPEANSDSEIDIGTSNGESRSLEGRIICIDPGHQTKGNYDTEPVAPGSDEMKAKVSSGTAGVKTRIAEYKLNLEVSLKLRDALEKYGATVIMTRTENNVDISNAERATMANEALADLYFRVHADGSTDKSVNGVSVLIPGKGHITDEFVLKESEKAGNCILEGFMEATGARKRGLRKRNDLSGFNWCKVPMVLIEMGFMSNPDEDEKLNTAEYQKKMVKGIVNGIVEYFQ
jgi:N-acetylmuramoyl-L-alanine amidase